MSRRYSAHETARKTKARRDFALERGELRGPSEPRVAAAGATSFPIKAVDPETERMIRDFLKQRAD